MSTTARLLEATAPDAFDEPAPLTAPELERYWSDVEFARQHDAERAAWQRQTHTLIDEGIRRARERREAERADVARGEG